MKQLLTTASLLALLAAGPAFAQTSPAPEPEKPSMGEMKPEPGTSVQAPSMEQPKTAMPVGQGEIRVSKLIGTPVRDSANEPIGNINDVLMTKDGQVESIIIGVGGFLGLGEKNVALRFSELKFDTSDPNAPKVTSATTSDALAAAPEWRPHGEKSGGSSPR